MKLSKVLLTGAVLFGVVGLEKDQSAIAQQTLSQGHQQAKTVGGLEAKVDENRVFNRAVDEVVIGSLIESYVDYLTSSSEFFSQLTSKFGKNKVMEQYIFLHKLCHNLALKYENKRIPREEFQELSKTIVYVQARLAQNVTNSGANYNNQVMYSAASRWAELKTWEFQKLLLASKKQEMSNIAIRQGNQAYVAELYKNAFTPEEYAWYVSQQNKVDDVVRDTLISTLRVGPIRRSIAEREIGMLKETAKRLRLIRFNRYFPGQGHVMNEYQRRAWIPRNPNS